MKNCTIIAVLLFAFSYTFAQTDCKPYVPTEEGTIWEITNYTAKGKADGRIVYELVEKKTTSDGLIFKIKSVSYDKKDKEIFTNNFEAACKNGKFELDMAFKMDGASMQTFQTMDVDVDASEYEIPSIDTPAGTQLKDGNLKVGMSGSPITMNMTVNITDRKVEAKEQISTSAGTFDCLVLTQTVSTKMIVNVQASSKEWYAENVGSVRTESYNKKGKLMGYSELTRLEKK